MIKNTLKLALLSLLFAANAVTAKDIVFVSQGIPAANNYTDMLPADFDVWCDGVCFPLVKLPLNNPKSGKFEGTVYAWGKNFTASCFEEFLVYELKRGDIYAIGPAACSAPLLEVPPVSPNADVRAAGGANGEVIGGTKRYKNQAGDYSTRLILEFGGGAPVFYDELFHRISVGPQDDE